MNFDMIPENQNMQTAFFAKRSAIDRSNEIIESAIRKKASDIHIEPGRDDTKIRFRIDGTLHRVLVLPKDEHKALALRLKILSNLKIDESRRPQDGRIELEKFPNISLRISVLPTVHGEKIVMRVLDNTPRDLSLKNLGFLSHHQEIIKRNLEKPFGMIISSGPTGSGKTTTLYALLNMLPKEEINISTLEDPIEYALQGINQVQINHSLNLTFPAGLHYMLRQDPDVIMVGEIRDSETAVMAANAALTGHLVFTTLHTNDSPSAFIRLLEMKVEDFVAGSAVNLIIGQRLVRKICANCAVGDILEAKIQKKIIERQDLADSLKSLGVDEKELGKRKFLKGKGCEPCLYSGYEGRVGIFEMLESDAVLHDLIMRHAPAEQIKKAAAQAGFREMAHDGIEKVLSGITTFEEVMRVTKNVSQKQESKPQPRAASQNSPVTVATRSPFVSLQTLKRLSLN